MPHIKKRLGYAEYGRLLDELTIRVAERSPTHVFGPPRGGLPIAVHLSCHLDLHMLGNEEVFAREWADGELLCLVDDIVDTGITFARLTSQLETANIPHLTAALYRKQHADITPDIHVRTTGRWIVFPWERQDEIPNR